MEEQSNFVYNEKVLLAVEDKLKELRKKMLLNAVINARKDPTCVREDGKFVVKPEHLTPDFDLHNIGVKGLTIREALDIKSKR